MSLQEWRARRQQSFFTPDGLEIVCRRVSLIDLAASGYIPAPLLGAVQQMQQRTQTQQGIDYSHLPEFGKLLGIICRAAIMHAMVIPADDAGEPQVVPVREQPSEEAIGLDEIDFETRVAIFTWANEGALALASFRGQQTADAQLARNGDDLSHAAIGDPGD
jgi:hypothetical protein